MINMKLKRIKSTNRYFTENNIYKVRNNFGNELAPKLLVTDDSGGDHLLTNDENYIDENFEVIK